MESDKAKLGKNCSGCYGPPACGWIALTRPLITDSEGGKELILLADLPGQIDLWGQEWWIDRG